MQDFRISPSFLRSTRQCTQQAKYQYRDRLKPIKEDIGLLRGRVVHKALQLSLTVPDLPSNILQLINRILPDYAKLDDVYKGIIKHYNWPHGPRSGFTYEDFKKQLVTATGVLLDYIAKKDLRPVILPESGVLAVEQKFDFELITPNGEILIEVGGNPLKVRNKIDLISEDGTGETAIYDWKVGLKKSSVKDGISPAAINDSLISYAIAAAEKVPCVSFPVTIYEVRAVVTLKGKASESVNYQGINGIEESRRVIEADEVEEFMRNAAAEAEDFINEKFRRQKSLHCTSMCNYNKICLLGKKDQYEVDPYWKERDARETTSEA